MQTAFSNWNMPTSLAEQIDSITTAAGLSISSVEIARVLQGWLLQMDSPIYMHANRELTKFREAIAARSEELFPFDFATLNGRFPIKEMKGSTESSEKVEDLIRSNFLHPVLNVIRKKSLEDDTLSATASEFFQDGQEILTVVITLVKTAVSAGVLGSMAHVLAQELSKLIMPQKILDVLEAYGWQGNHFQGPVDLNALLGQLQTMKACALQAMQDGIIVDENDGSLRVRPYILEAARKGTSTSTTLIPVDDTDNQEMNDIALLYFKAVQASAVDYCRPKLTKMMARLYQIEEIRRALLRTRGPLSFERLFGDLRSEQESELQRCEARYNRMDEEFRLAQQGQLLEGATTVNRRPEEVRQQEVTRLERLRKVRVRCEEELENKRQELRASEGEMKMLQENIDAMRTSEEEMKFKDEKLREYQSKVMNQESDTRKIYAKICREAGKVVSEDDVTADMCLLAVHESKKWGRCLFRCVTSTKATD
jgi:hypothetical protein